MNTQQCCCPRPPLSSTSSSRVGTQHQPRLTPLPALHLQHERGRGSSWWPPELLHWNLHVPCQDQGAGQWQCLAGDPGSAWLSWVQPIFTTWVDVLGILFWCTNICCVAVCLLYCLLLLLGMKMNVNVYVRSCVSVPAIQISKYIISYYVVFGCI